MAKGISLNEKKQINVLMLYVSTSQKTDLPVTEHVSELLHACVKMSPDVIHQKSQEALGVWSHCGCAVAISWR